MYRKPGMPRGLTSHAAHYRMDLIKSVVYSQACLDSSLDIPELLSLSGWNTQP